MREYSGQWYEVFIDFYSNFQIIACAMKTFELFQNSRLAGKFAYFTTNLSNLPNYLKLADLPNFVKLKNSKLYFYLNLYFILKYINSKFNTFLAQIQIAGMKSKLF